MGNQQAMNYNQAMGNQQTMGGKKVMVATRHATGNYSEYDEIKRAIGENGKNKKAVKSDRRLSAIRYAAGDK